MTLASLSIRHAQIDILKQHTYIVNHITHQIGSGVDSADLYSCIYTCHNNDFCRTAVFDDQLLICFLFEECSFVGQIVPNVYRTLLSFQLCSNEPVNVAFSPSLIKSMSLQTVMSSLTWIKYLTPTSNSWYPFFLNDQIYVPLQNMINVYETDTYTLVQSIPIPVTSGIIFLRADSQDTFIYRQWNDPNFYIYSLERNILTSINSSLTNFGLCYSASFIVITSMSLRVTDVYLRTIVNNSATFIYRISGWNPVQQCVIINDHQLISALYTGGLQTTMLSKTYYNSTIITLPLNTSYLPTGAMLSVDAAGRLYAAPSGSWNTSTVFLSDGTLVGTHGGYSGLCRKSQQI